MHFLCSIVSAFLISVGTGAHVLLDSADAVRGPAHPAVEPVVRRVDVPFANATTGTYWPCDKEQGVDEGEVCVPSEAEHSSCLRSLQQKLRRHRRWVRVRGTTITPDDGRQPRPINVLSPTWRDTGISAWSLDGLDYYIALRDLPLVTTHRQICRYVPAPFEVSPPFELPDEGLLCAHVRNRDAGPWWAFWRSRS